MGSFLTDLLDRFDEVHANIEKALEPLPQEAMDWSPGPEMNSLSVLIIHITGAERYWVGDIVIGEPSNRDRDAEFKASGLDKNILLRRLHETEAYIAGSLSRVKPSDLETTRIHPRRGDAVSVTWALLYAFEHVVLHLGHIQMTAQLWQQKYA